MTDEKDVMTRSHSWQAPGDPVARPARRSDQLLGLYQMLVWVYGGFLLGILSYAYRAGDDIVFWPWSLLFILLLVGLLIWQQRRRSVSHPPAGP